MTFEAGHAKLISGSVISRNKNPLPKRASKRGALTYSYSKTKPRLSFFNKGFRLKSFFPKISLAIFAVVFLLGYQPTLGFPPIKKNISFASEGINQSAQIESQTIPSLQLPHSGYLSTKYSRFHPGIDLAIGFGTPIKPIAPGNVEAVNKGFFGYGNQVIISHSGNLTSMYAHLGKVYVKKGEAVSLDTILGTVGLTGFTSGPHTHLEITLEGRSIDPLTVLPSIPTEAKEEFLTSYKTSQELSHLQPR